jgi:hypothetical protein
MDSTLSTLFACSKGRYNCAFRRGLDPSVLYEQYGIPSLAAHYYDKASSNTSVMSYPEIYCGLGMVFS